MTTAMGKTKGGKQTSNIRLLAKKLSLSVGTVSNVFNRPEIVAEATRQRVLDAADELGYRPDYFGRALARGRSATIGIIGGMFGSATTSSNIHEIIQSAQKQNYLTHALDVSQRGDDTAGVKNAARDLLDRKVDGLVVYRSKPISDELAQFFEGCPVPVVLLGDWQPENYHHYINLELNTAVENLAEHLTNLGHKRVAYVPSNESFDSLEHKIRPYQRAFLKRHIDFVTDRCWVVNKSAQDLSEEAYHSVTDCLGKEPDVTALLMNNDLSAMGALAAARDRGLRVPQDISVVGFDCLAGTQFLTPALTTIRPPDSAQVGQAAFNMLSALMDDPQAEVEPQTFSFELVVRESTGPAKHGGTGVPPVILTQQEKSAGRINEFEPQRTHTPEKMVDAFEDSLIHPTNVTNSKPGGDF